MGGAPRFRSRRLRAAGTRWPPALALAAWIAATPRSAVAQTPAVDVTPPVHPDPDRHDPAPPPPPTQPTLGAPRVHVVTTDRQVILFREPSPAERETLGPAYRPLGVPVCRAPCDRVIDGRAGQVFWFGRGARPSSGFLLRDRAGDLTLEVHRDVDDALWVSEPPRAPTLGAPRIHVATRQSEDRDVILFRQPSPDEREQLGQPYRKLGVPICRAPCDQVVDGRWGQSYLIGGPDIIPSRPFLLVGRTGNLTLEVRPASFGKAPGALMSALGGAATGIGLTQMLVAAAIDPPLRQDGTLFFVGALLGGGGLALLGGGIAVIVLNRTVVTARPSVMLDRGVLRF